TILISSIIILSALLIYTTSCKNGNPDNKEKFDDAKSFLFLTPEQQPEAYRNIDKLFNTRTFKRGQSVFPMPKSDQPLTSVKYSPDGVNTYDIDDFVKRNRVSGLLIIKDGKIVLERYALGNNDSSRWTSFSVAKSFTSTLIGMAVKDGKIKSLDDKVTYYLPQMRGTSYEAVTVGQLMTMSSGVKWNEDYRDSSSSLTALFQCPLEGKKGGMIDVMAKLPRAATPGKKFLYSTGETCLEGEVLTAALKGESMSAYLSRKLWANMGMEADGYWLLESPDGHEFAGGNLSMTLRDYGRFGMFILHNGVVKGDSLLPSGWVSQISQPPVNSPQLAYGKLYSAMNTPEYTYYYPFGYSYNWWCMDQTPWGAWDALDNTTVWGADAIKASKEKFTNLQGTFSAIGIFGQYIHVNQKENMVTVIWSAWKDPNLDPKEYEAMCFLNAATGYLRK
ncbi:MAG: serine hydrolase, partial [Bacteroidota bacterium]